MPVALFAPRWGPVPGPYSHKPQQGQRPVPEEPPLLPERPPGVTHTIPGRPSHAPPPPGAGRGLPGAPQSRYRRPGPSADAGRPFLPGRAAMPGKQTKTKRSRGWSVSGTHHFGGREEPTAPQAAAAGRIPRLTLPTPPPRSSSSRRGAGRAPPAAGPGPCRLLTWPGGEE